ALDILEFGRCGGPMRLQAFVDDEGVTGKILEYLGLPARAPPRARRRHGLKLLPFVHVTADLDGIDPLQLDGPPPLNGAHRRSCARTAISRRGVRSPRR